MTTTAQAIVQTMIDAGVKRVFTLPGLGVSRTLDRFFDRQDEIDVLLCRTEIVASVMAQVTGRLTGQPGIFMGQGPFASTLGAFGIMEAHMSGSPMVILTDDSEYSGYGQYGVYQGMTGEYGTSDVKGALKGITKYCCYATDPTEAVYGLQMAFKHASLPRTGPAALIMKSGIVREEIDETTGPKLYPLDGYLKYTPQNVDKDAIQELANLIDGAKQPVFVVGNGVLAANAQAAISKLAGDAGIAVATSYNAKGAVDETAPYAVGMMGNWGCKTANKMVEAADLVVMVGASMGPDYTKFRDPKMIRPGDQTLVQVDIDPRNAGWVYPVDLAITADAADALGVLAAIGLDTKNQKQRLDGIAKVQKANGYGEFPEMTARQGSVHPVDIVKALQRFLGPDDYLTLDAGANRIFTTVLLRMTAPGQLLASGGIGGMGWGAPAAAAAKLVHPDKRVTNISGDGGFGIAL
ncbi:MAG TPA: thiamine pyrophosphate-binding protein, partial [Rhodospirillaceae bacterium]|nr:thiamine pyrophosphate-binding protein [Rhodospirillaceae bacterium]